MPKKLAVRVIENLELVQAYGRDLADAVRDIKELDKQLRADEKSREGLEEERDGLIKKKEALEEQIVELKKLDKEIDEKKAEQKEAQGKEKAAIGAEIKALEAKAKKLGGDPAKVEKGIEAIEKELKKNQDAWEKSVKYSEGFLKRKQEAEELRDELIPKQRAAEAETQVLAVKERDAAEVDALTLDNILDDPVLRNKFGVLTYNKPATDFLTEMERNGNCGDLAIYKKYVETDEINLDGLKPLKKKFEALGAQGAQAEWDSPEARKMWADAVAYVVRMFHRDARQLDQFQTMLKEERGAV